MRHDELKASIHKYFKNALATQLDRLGANGPMSERDLAPYQTAQDLAEASEEDFWDILHPEGADAFLRQFCAASGIPQSEAATNPERLMREYKLAWRDMLRMWEKHRLSLDAYDYAHDGSSGLVLEEPIYQSIVGHERQGVTQQVYLRQGYTLPQLKAAIDMFEV